MSYPRITILVVLIVAAAASLVFSFGLNAGLNGTNQSQSVQQQLPEVAPAEHHDLSPPLFAIPPAPRQKGFRVHDHERLPRPDTRGIIDPVVQRAVAPALMPTTLLNFNGIGNGFSGFTVQGAPPDTNGDIGPNHYVQIVNTDFAIFNKSGAVLFGPVPINTLWSGFGGGCQTNDDGDPLVVYDPIADRWVISQFSVSTTPYLECVAVSQTPDPTGAYYRYSFSYVDFNDYPKVGVWPDAYYITFNSFAGGSTFNGSRVCAYDRTKMLTGQPATQQCFQTNPNYGGLLPADLDGARQPPVGSPNYILGLGTGTNDLAFWKFHVDWTTPANTTFTGPISLTIAPYAEACSGGTCIPQSGTTQQLDSLADRLMYRLAYRNFGDHESLVFNHSVTVGSSVGVRWYEIRSPGTAPTVFQQGTYAPDSNFRWMGSIAMDQQGNMALGFSVSGSSIRPQIHTTGRLVGDALGVMTQGEGTIINGAGSQTGQSLSRWGDYSMMAVDPVDDCTFWYTTEYIPANGAFNWSTRIASFKFPGCGGTTPTPTPPPLVNISGTISYCSNPALNPVPGVVMTLTGSSSGSTATDGSGNYTFAGLVSGGNYTVTPTKTALAPGSTGINTVDVIGTQRHFLNITPLTGCRLTAADVNGSSTVDTVDVIAIQRFFLGLSTGTANVGKSQFSPTSRAYPGVTSNQTGQNYNALVFGDVASPFAERPSSPSQEAAGAPTPIDADEARPPVAVVALPNVAIAPLMSPFTVGVATSAIDAKDRVMRLR